MDMTGKLIGLNTLGHDNANSLFFAVPITPIITVIERVVAADKNQQVFKTPTIGFSAYDRHQAQYGDIDFEKDGMLLTEITENGPSVGKLQKNDIVVEITLDGNVYTINDRNDLLFVLLKADVGDTVTVGYLRGLIKNTTNITLG